MRKKELKYGELNSSLVAEGLIVGMAATLSKLETRVVLLESSVPITAKIGAVRLSIFFVSFDLHLSPCPSSSSFR